MGLLAAIGIGFFEELNHKKIRPEDVEFLSRYPAHNIRRFGRYSLHLDRAPDSRKIPSNLSFIHGRIAVRAINLRRLMFGTRFAGIEAEHAKNTINQRRSD
ncbi:hypothetical protein PQR68_32305 [Paraburkholderia agricolaris]|uniref:hypothetical protein n=1 Tax=Paraburkholderia agricolaris TaxID=2152888 RepID=UPI0038BAA1B6